MDFAAMPYSPTRLALLIALALLVPAVLALVEPSLALSWALLVCLLLLLMGVDALLLKRGVSLAIRREHPAEAGVGIPFHDTLTLANQGRASVTGRMYDLVPVSLEGPREPLPFSLAPGKAAAWERDFTPLDRGQSSFDRATVTLYGPLRLMRRAIFVSAPSTVSAMPGIEVLRSNELILKAARDADAGVTTARGVGRGGEFESLAPYVPGDPPQSVDWKAFARTGQLAVRRYIPERRRHIMLACDAGRLMGQRCGAFREPQGALSASKGALRKVDLALTALIKVAAAALQRGDLVGMVVFDREVRQLVPPRGGSGQLSRLVRASLAVEPGYEETAFTPAFVALNHVLPRRALVLLTTDFDNDAQGWELQRNIAQISRRHVAIVAAIRDPVYHRTVEANVSDIGDAYRQLAALTLLEERRGILAGVHASGVHVIDAEPDDITGPMLNMYGRVVTSGRL